MAGRVLRHPQPGKIAFVVQRTIPARDSALLAASTTFDEKNWEPDIFSTLGDIIGATGVMRNSAAASFPAVTSLEVLSKSLRPLPEKVPRSSLTARFVIASATLTLS